MKPRSIGRGRLMVAVGAIVTLAGSALPWWRVGGMVTPVSSGNALDGSGILVFIAALGLGALVLLPLAARTGESALDRPVSYALLTGVGIGAFVIRLIELFQANALSAPDTAPGLWVTGAGLAIVAWGVAEVIAQPASES